MSLVLNYTQIKHLVRSGLQYDSGSEGLRSRVEWWPVLSSIEKTSILALSTTDEQQNVIADRLLRLAKKDETKIALYNTTTDLNTKAEIIYEIECNINNSIEHPIKPFIIEILKHIVVCESNPAKSLMIINNITTNTKKYFTPTVKAYGTILYTFKKLLEKFMPQTYAVMMSRGDLADKYLNLFFIDFFNKLVSNEIVNRILDSFLCEGFKVLYRYALAFLQVHKAYIKGNVSSGISSDDLWKYMMTHKLGNVTPVSFTKMAFEFNKVGIKSIVRPMNISNTFINNLMTEASNVLDSSVAIVTLPFDVNNLAELLHGQSTSGSITTNNFIESNCQSAIISTFMINSNILNESLIKTLISYLPSTIIVEGLSLAFSTARDGWSLDYLYAKMSKLSPVLMICKSLKSKAIFGAYIDAEITPPSSKVKGGGLSFVFRLDQGKEAKYNWVGLNNKSKIDYSLTEKQISIFSSNFIMIGASNELCTNAIYIGEDLHTFSTGFSDTYKNPPLLDKDEYINGQSTFQVENIELWTGIYSINHRF